MEKKHVILLWNYLEWGGAQIYFLSIIKNAPKNWKFTIVLPRNSKQDLINFFEPYDVEFDYLPETSNLEKAENLSGKLKNQASRIKGEFEIYRHLQHRYDLEKSILHIESAPWQSWLLLYALALRGNVFVTLHNAVPKNIPVWRKTVWKKRLNILAARRNFNFFCANQNVIESLKDYIEPRYQNKLILTRASIDPSEIERVESALFDKKQMRKTFSLPEDKFIVLCVGQFIDRKGRWIYLESAREIRKINKNIFFVWLAQQAPNEIDQKKIVEFGVDENFRFILSKSVGKNHEEVLQFFRLADAFALPSFWEGLPIAVLEAMALGIATVSTDINAIPEAVKHLETGMLIKPGDAHELSAAIVQLYEDENLRKRLAENGRRFVLENFDERIAGRTALENYEKCLAN